MGELLVFVIEIVLTFLWEVVLSAVVEGLFEIGWHSLLEPFRNPNRDGHEAVAAVLASPLVAGAGLLMLGGMIGATVTFIFQTRLFQPVLLPGSSLVLLPLALGCVMALFGRVRSNPARRTPFFATFSGGAVFAFGLAAIRLLMLSTAG